MQMTEQRSHLHVVSEQMFSSQLGQVRLKSSILTLLSIRLLINGIREAVKPDNLLYSPSYLNEVR